MNAHDRFLLVLIGVIPLALVAKVFQVVFPLWVLGAPVTASLFLVAYMARTLPWIHARHKEDHRERQRSK